MNPTSFSDQPTVYFDRFRQDFLDLNLYQNDQGQLIGIDYRNSTLRKDNPFRSIKASCRLIKKDLSVIKQEFTRYLQGESKFFEIDFLFKGTEFQNRIWNFLQTIPYGKVVSYSEIASSVNRPHSWRAVGNAVGANPLSIVIPCHRVLHKNKNRVGNYGGGSEIKQRLLELEQVQLAI